MKLSSKERKKRNEDLDRIEAKEQEIATRAMQAKSYEEVLHIINEVGASEFLSTIELWDGDFMLMSQLRKRIKEIRKQHCLTVREMARRLSRSFGSYRVLETQSKTNNIKLRDILAIIHKFGVSERWLLTGEDFPFNRFARGVMMMRTDYKFSFKECFSLQLYTTMEPEPRLYILELIFYLHKITSMHKRDGFLDAMREQLGLSSNVNYDDMIKELEKHYDLSSSD